MWQRNGTIEKPCFSAKASLETFFIREAQSVKIRITYSVSFGNWKQSIRAVTMNVQVEASALNVENDHADALRKKVKNRFPDSATFVDFPRTEWVSNTTRKFIFNIHKLLADVSCGMCKILFYICLLRLSLTRRYFLNEDFC